MGKITLNNDISKLFVGNDEVATVYYGDTLVYQKYGADVFILNMTSGEYEDTNGVICYGLSLMVKVGRTDGGTLTFNGETKVLPPNQAESEQTIRFFIGYVDDPNYQPVTDNLIITGNILNIGIKAQSTSGGTYYRIGGHVNSVVRWYSDKNYLVDMFYFSYPDDSYPLTFNLALPSNIEDASRLRQNFTAPYSLSFTNNLKKIARVKSLTTANTGVQLKNNSFYYIDDVLINRVPLSSGQSPTVITIPNNTRVIGQYMFQGESESYELNLPTDGVLKEIPFNFASLSEISAVNIPSGIEVIDGAAFGSCPSLLTVTIPDTVNKIGSFAFSNSSGSMNISTMTFNQPRDMQVELPTAGSLSGFLYVKTARNMNIYTDNLIIKNYNYSADNITATLYHLDGTPW